MYYSCQVREAQPFPALLSARQRCDLHGQIADILLIPHNHLLYLNGGSHAVVEGTSVVVAGGDNTTSLGFASQIPGSIADDLRLRLALLQHTFAEAAHGHHTDLILEYTGGRLDLQLALGCIHGRTSSGAHRGDDTGLPGQDASPQASHGVETRRP